MRDAGGQTRGIEETVTYEDAEDEDRYKSNEVWVQRNDELNNDIFTQRDHAAAAQHNQLILQDVPRRVWGTQNDNGSASDAGSPDSISISDARSFNNREGLN